MVNRVVSFLVFVFCTNVFADDTSLYKSNAYAQVSADGAVAVATVNPYATNIAMNVVKAGGNAVDAAIAATFALGVVDGQNSGIGGGCLILVRLANGNIYAVDGREMAPAAARSDMYIVNGKADPELSRTGALAIGVPGVVMALHKLQMLGGNLKFRENILPSAELANTGFLISNSMADRLASSREKLSKYPSSAAIFLDTDNRPHKAGTLLQQPDLSLTYKQIAKYGPDYFYKGEFAKKVAEWMSNNGGLITQKDLAAYEIRMREPVVAQFAGYTLYGFPPPSSGGIHVAQILNILENFKLSSVSPADRYHLLADAMQFAFADRAQWLGDSDYTSIPKGLIDKRYAKLIAEKMTIEKRSSDVSYGNPDVDIQALMNKHTTHISAADLEGNWVSITSTVNTSFGSKVVIPGTGVVLNNQMDDFSAQLGSANAFGLVGSEANSVQGRKRPLSSMSPTLVFKNNKPVMTLGAAGGPTIISQVVQILLYTLVDGMTAEEALKQPRIHQQWSPNTLYVESKMHEDIQQSLKAKGHDLKIWPSIGAAQVIQLQNGKLVPSSEPRIILQNGPTL